MSSHPFYHSIARLRDSAPYRRSSWRSTFQRLTRKLSDAEVSHCRRSLQRTVSDVRPAKGSKGHVQKRSRSLRLLSWIRLGSFQIDFFVGIPSSSSQYCFFLERIVDGPKSDLLTCILCGRTPQRTRTHFRGTCVSRGSVRGAVRSRFSHTHHRPHRACRMEFRSRCGTPLSTNRAVGIRK